MFHMTTQEQRVELPQEPRMQVCLPLLVGLEPQRWSHSKTTQDVSRMWIEKNMEVKPVQRQCIK